MTEVLIYTVDYVMEKKCFSLEFKESQESLYLYV